MWKFCELISSAARGRSKNVFQIQMRAESQKWIFSWYRCVEVHFATRDITNLSCMCRFSVTNVTNFGWKSAAYLFTIKHSALWNIYVYMMCYLLWTTGSKFLNLVGNQILKYEGGFDFCCEFYRIIEFRKFQFIFRLSKYLIYFLNQQISYKRYIFHI